MTDLFRHISLHGYDKLVDSGLLSYERFFWFCLHATIFVFMYIALTFTWDQFVMQTFSINLHNPLYPVENVPFPAVSICSNNRISRKAAAKYALQLSRLDPANRSVEYFEKSILHFMGLYFQYERSDDFDAYGEFQKFLDHYATDNNETFYNILGVMKMLTPSCENLIINCMLGTKPIECFSKNAFQSQLTMYGPCCTFNANNVYSKRSYSTRYAGSNMGLIVILNTSQSDDTGSLLNMDGYAVLVHAPNKFPDTSSGGILEVFPSTNEESYLAVRARVTDSDPDLRTFTASHRKCYFDNESPYPQVLVNNRYSMQNCITSCRAKSVMALCNCIPFYMPLALIEGAKGIPFCTLSNIECIQQYRFKWRNVLTHRVEIMGLEREHEEALFCPACLPSCDDIRYSISMMSLPVDQFSFLGGVSAPQLKDSNTQISVLRVFFGDTTAQFYRRVLTNAWSKAFCTVGNIVSICMGFSLVAILEMLYFVLKNFFASLKTYVKKSTSRSKWRRVSRLSTANSKQLLICP
ncbi:pickpocket protein 28 [Stomoxys calcitrans]|uniref:pickpocket protein 28 n=1 Tax=Stomoxys calcitrans TaxID=35570 RepID=UPI0027E3212B|nr:pickpocket protein 28 [Stomoxys calcitrans]